MRDAMPHFAEVHAERQREEEERKRCSALRDAGVTANGAYRPPDWDDESHGPWVVPVRKLLEVRPPNPLTGRAEKGGFDAAREEEVAAREVEVGEMLAAELARSTNAALDERTFEEVHLPSSCAAEHGARQGTPLAWPPRAADRVAV